MVPTGEQLTELETKFWPRIKKTGACWEWIGERTSGGYGLATLWRKHQRVFRVYAHRLSYAIHNHQWPSGIILHSCDNPGCVNPEHLSEGTQADNVADMVQKGRARGRLSDA